MIKKGTVEQHYKDKGKIILYLLDNILLSIRWKCKCKCTAQNEVNFECSFVHCGLLKCTKEKKTLTLYLLVPYS